MIALGAEWVVPLVAAAASWGGARASLNGTRKRVEQIDGKVDGIVETMSEVRERVGKLEGIVETKKK